MKRMTVLAVLLLTVVALSTEVAQAQGRRGGGFGQPGGGLAGMFGRGGGGGVSAMDLATRSDVQKELDLSDDQIADIRKVAEEARAARRGGGAGFDFGALRDMSEEERRDAFAKIVELRQKQISGQSEKVMELLSSSQKSRLKQLTFQMALDRGASDAAAEAAGVELDDDAKEKLAEARREIMERLNAQIAKLRREANMEVLETVMSATQIERAAGEAFTFEQQERRGFGGFGAGGPGAGGRGAGGPRRRERPAAEGDADDGGTRRRRR